MSNDKPVKLLGEMPKEFKPLPMATGDSCGPPSEAVRADTGACCCGGPTVSRDWPAPGPDLPFVDGEVPSSSGPVPRVPAELTVRDHLGSFAVRWGYRRMDYAIPPGLYAIGSPDSSSEVLVTANYKLSFDKLRAALPGRSAWILVLDTVGINVWCAAGKGTFGTAELNHRIEDTRLAEVVDHHRVIVPQLGAPGVAAHEVKSSTGFKVVYGPVLAEDLPRFLDAGRKATEGMRRKDFPLWERFVLVPVELVSAIKYAAVLSLVFFFTSGLGGPADYWSNALSSGLLAVFSLAGAVLAGAVLTPLMLPWLPGRAFSVKGVVAGIITAVAVLAWRGNVENLWYARLEAGAWLLIIPALAAFMAMNFTGASTYTSLSGVEREMRKAIPLQIGAAGVGLLLWIGSRLVA